MVAIISQSGLFNNIVGVVTWVGGETGAGGVVWL